MIDDILIWNMKKKNIILVQYTEVNYVQFSKESRKYKLKNIDRSL